MRIRAKRFHRWKSSVTGRRLNKQRKSLSREGKRMKAYYRKYFEFES